MIQSVMLFFISKTGKSFLLRLVKLFEIKNIMRLKLIDWNNNITSGFEKNYHKQL